MFFFLWWGGMWVYRYVHQQFLSLVPMFSGLQTLWNPDLHTYVRTYMQWSNVRGLSGVWWRVECDGVWSVMVCGVWWCVECDGVWSVMVCGVWWCAVLPTALHLATNRDVHPHVHMLHLLPGGHTLYLPHSCFQQSHMYTMPHPHLACELIGCISTCSAPLQLCFLLCLISAC